MSEYELVKFEERIREKIYSVRGYQVMLDRDLAELYEVETKRINEAVKRNIERFPQSFCFSLNIREMQNLKSQIATSSWGGKRKKNTAFTEQGVAMLVSKLEKFE